MSVSCIDMEIPNIDNSPLKNRAPTIKEEQKSVTKKRTQSAKPRNRYGYSGQLKTLNNTKQSTFMSGGKDMICLQSEVKQSSQDLELMNSRIAALKRNVERAEKKKRDIDREKNMSVKAS